MGTNGVYTSWHLFAMNSDKSGVIKSKIANELRKEWLIQECGIINSYDCYETLSRLEDRNLMPLFDENCKLVGWDNVKYDLSDFVHRSMHVSLHVIHGFSLDPDEKRIMDYLSSKMEAYKESFRNAARAVLSHALEESALIIPSDMDEEESLSFDNLEDWMAETDELEDVALEVNLNMSEADRLVFDDKGTIVPEDSRRDSLMDDYEAYKRCWIFNHVEDWRMEAVREDYEAFLEYFRENGVKELPAFDEYVEVYLSQLKEKTHGFHGDALFVSREEWEKQEGTLLQEEYEFSDR